MRDIATTTFTGNLTRDPELKSLPSGIEIARLRVANTTRRKSGEEWVDKTNYFTVDVFGAQARACHDYLAKGSRIAVDGEPEWREWTDQDGGHREAITFKARQVLFLNSARTTNNQAQTEPAGATSTAASPAHPAAAPPSQPVAAAATNSTAVTSEDLPF